MKKSGNLTSSQSRSVVTPEIIKTAIKVGLMPSQEALRQSLKFQFPTKPTNPSATKKQIFKIPQQPIKIAIAQSSESGKTPQYNVEIIGDQRSADPSIIYAASAFQSILNAVQRQILGNLGLRALATDKPKITPTFLLGGITPRILNNLFGIMPSLMLKKEMQAAKFGRLETIIAATALETLTGAPLEVWGAKPALAKMGFPIQSLGELSKVSARISPFHFARNMAVWSMASIGSGEMNVGTKAALGAVAGSASIIPHNIGNLLMMEGGKPFGDAVRNVCQHIIDNPRMLLKGIELRGAAGIFGTLALSHECAEFSENLLQGIYDALSSLRPTPQPKDLKSSSISEFDNLSESEKIDLAQSAVKIYLDAVKEVQQTKPKIDEKPSQTTKATTFEQTSPEQKSPRSIE